jgi:hypothetical protein
MRNLLEHPITDQEIVACLKTQAAKCDSDDLVGDMRSVLLLTAADMIASPHKCNHHTIITALEALKEKLNTVVLAAEACIHDDRHCGGEVTFVMGGHRRIRLADALKALKA